MSVAFEKLSNYESIAVWAMKGNDRVIHFYKRYGFCFDGAEVEIVLATPNTKLRVVYEREP